MKIQQITEYELRKKILEIKSKELFDEALDIWKDENSYDKFGKWKRFWFDPFRGKIFDAVKEIQMGLVDNELDEALNDTKGGFAFKV